MRAFIETFDHTVIAGIRALFGPVARLALATVFFWFGLLKVMGVSPADALVSGLLHALMPSWNPAGFLVFLGVYEMTVGIAFLVPRLERLAIALLIPHMLSTFLPFAYLPDALWTRPFVPTLEGQYILKNAVIVALALGLAARLRPFHLENGNKNRACRC